MNNILDFPASTTMTPEQALLSTLELARTENVTDVLIVGYVDGNLIIRSSRMNRQDALWLAECLRRYAMGPNK